MPITSLPRESDSLPHPGGEGGYSVLFCLIFPFILVLPPLILLISLLPHEQWVIFCTLLAAYVIPPAGKESIIPFGIMLGYPWWIVCSAIILIDIGSAIFTALNFHYLLRIPVIGELFLRCSEGIVALEEGHQWIRRFSHLGLFLFVLFPLQGSGAISGTILGRLIGMRPRPAFITIIGASILSCILLALGVNMIDSWTNHNLAVLYPLLALIIGFTGFIWFRSAYQSHRR